MAKRTSKKPSAAEARADVRPTASSATSLPPLTPRQQQVLDIVTASLRHTSVFPSLRDIARQLGVKSPSGVAGHLKALASKGYLARTQAPLPTSEFVLPPHPPLGSKGRGGKPIPLAARLEQGAEQGPKQGFPLVAQIAAGSPHEAYAYQQQDMLFFSYDYFGGGDLKALSVEGQSMLGDAIDDGDIVIIDTRLADVTSLPPSRIVAVRVLGGEFSLKRIALAGDRVELIPSNPDYSSRFYPQEDVEVLGVMVGLVRRF